MDNTAQLASLKSSYDRIIKLDKKKIFKENLGDESIKNVIEKDYDDFIAKNDKIIKYGYSIPGKLLTEIRKLIDNLFSQFESISNQNNQEFIANKSNIINNTRSLFEEFYMKWSITIPIILEEKGFLEDEGVKNLYDNLIVDLKQNSEKTIDDIRKESEKILEEAKELASQIETKARKTAAKISVEDAQKQFKEAQVDHLKSVKLWTWLSSISLVLFVGIALAFYFDLPELEEGLMIYKTVIRATILVSIGAIATFCLKILRSSYHMYKHNQHRQRIANSMGSFVESAVTPEQRDLILTHLVESIANFGNSGLVHGDDDNINASKFVVDNLIRNISPKN